MAALYKINCFKNRNNQNELVMKVVLIVLKLLNRNIFRWIQLIFENQKFAIFDGFLYSFDKRCENKG